MFILCTSVLVQKTDSYAHSNFFWRNENVNDGNNPCTVILLHELSLGKIHKVFRRKFHRQFIA